MLNLSVNLLMLALCVALTTARERKFEEEIPQSEEEIIKEEKINENIAVIRYLNTS